MSNLFDFVKGPAWSRDPAGREEWGHRIGMKGREVRGYLQVDDGVVVQTIDGNMVIVLSQTDSLGRPPGTVLYYARPGVPVPRGLAIGVYAADDHGDSPDTVRTLDDLVADAAFVVVPDVALRSHRDALAWVGDDIVRAVALWVQQGRAFGLPLQQVVERSTLAQACRTIVVAEGVAA